MLVPYEYPPVVYSYVFIGGPEDGLRLELEEIFKAITIPPGFHSGCLMSLDEIEANIDDHGHPYKADTSFYEYVWNGVVDEGFRVMVFKRWVGQLNLSK